MQNEEAKLKKKVNRLIDRVTEGTRQIEEKNRQGEELEQEIKALQRKLQAGGEDGAPGASAAERRVLQEGESGLLDFMCDFYHIARMIITKEDYIRYNYATKNSEMFFKIEQSVFDDYICRYARIDLKAFLNRCMELMMVKSDDNGKCVFTSGDIRVYYVSRAFMEASVQRRQEA